MSNVKALSSRSLSSLQLVRLKVCSISYESIEVGIEFELTRSLLINAATGCLWILSNLLLPSAYGQYLDPTSKTQVNKVDPLFNRSVDNYHPFEKEIESFKESAASKAGSGEGFNDLVGSDKAENNAKDLSNIQASELETRGRAEYAKDPSIDEYFVDYSKPGMKMHQIDAETIASSSSKMMNSIFDMLKEVGVDCKSVKGDKEVEPEYFIETETKLDRDKGDTIYDQFFCEHLRDKYSCIDNLTLTCRRKGMKWEGWQDKTIEIEGSELYHNTFAWFNGIKTKKRKFVYFLRNNQHVQYESRNYIAKKTGVSSDHIHEHISYADVGVGDPYRIEGKAWVYPRYVFHYKYRDGKLVCQEWHEDWTERCRLD